MFHSCCMYYAEAYDELAGPISASLRTRNTASFEKMSHWWRAFGNTASDLKGPKFEPQTSRSRDERVTARVARPTGRSLLLVVLNIVSFSTLAEFVMLYMFGNERLLVL